MFHLLKAGKSFGGGMPELKDKTLVCWVSPADLEQHGAGVLTIEGDRAQFDSLVLGEVLPRRWMAGSDGLERTQRDQRQSAEETAPPGQWVQIVAVYAGKTVTLFRNGKQYASYAVNHPLGFAAGSRVVLGLRHVERRGDPASYFRGQIADARVYNRALTAAEIAALRPHEAAGPKPLVWFDFKMGNTVDRAGTLRPAELEGNVSLRCGALVLGGEGCLLSSGAQIALAHLVSADLKTWKELPEPFLVADRDMVPQMCPHWFHWNDWYYFIGGVGGIWKSRQPFGPWTLQSPRQLDALAVPKTGAFSGNRRLFTGFLGDGGWGGNLVLRDLVQHADGTLGTRFVPEIIPAAGEPIAIHCADVPGNAVWSGAAARLAAKSGRQQILFDGVPNDARITMVLEPQGPVAAYGLRLRTTDGQSDGTELTLQPHPAHAIFSVATASGGETSGGTGISGLRGLDRAVRLDVICRHDLIDVEIGGRHTLINRFWNPKGNRLAIWVAGGAISVRDLTIRGLLEHTPPGALRPPERTVATPGYDVKVEQ